MLLPWLTLFDLRGIFANFAEPKKVDYKHKCDDFVILIPIFNDVSFISNIDFLKKYPGKVAFCTTDLETPEFYKDLNKIAKDNGFSVIKCAFNQGVKNPWKIYHKTLLAHDYVLGKALDILKAKYVIFLDADTTCRTDIAYLAGAMERHDLDLASVRVIPSKRGTVAEELQYIEYHIAMKSRRIYPWLTSGAAMIGKRERMEEIMKKHSLFFNGGDVEIGKIANLTGLKVDHIPVTFYTDVPATLWKLFRQRFSWFCGAFRHSVINFHTNLFSPVYALYFTLIIFLMLPLKLYEIVAHWYIVPFLFLFYITVTTVSNWEIRSPYMLLFPFYSLFQVLVMPICGIGRYVKTVIKTKNTGFIKLFYKSRYHPMKYALNLLLIAGVVFAIFNIHDIERALALSNINVLTYLGIDTSGNSAAAIIFNGMKLFLVLTSLYLFLFAFFKAMYHPKTKRSLQTATLVVKTQVSNMLNAFR